MSKCGGSVLELHELYSAACFYASTLCGLAVAFLRAPHAHRLFDICQNSASRRLGPAFRLCIADSRHSRNRPAFQKINRMDHVARCWQGYGMPSTRTITMTGPEFFRRHQSCIISMKTKAIMYRSMYDTQSGLSASTTFDLFIPD